METKEAGLKPLLLGPLLEFIFLARMQHDLVRVTGRHAHMPFAPIIGNRIRQDSPRGIERHRAYGARLRIERYIPSVNGKRRNICWTHF